MGAPSPLSTRLQAVRARIEAAGRDPDHVTVVAVTKGQQATAVIDALAAGLEVVGENYASELLDKAARVASVDDSLHPRWHLIGSIQRRTVARLAPVVQCWQSVWRNSEGETLSRHAPGAAVLVEVNLTGRAERPGVALAELAPMARDLSAMGLDVGGVMAVGAAGPPEQSRRGFRELARAAADLGLATVSMGMTDDLEVAVEEGSTMVRVGRGLFGPRADRP